MDCDRGIGCAVLGEPEGQTRRRVILEGVMNAVGCGVNDKRGKRERRSEVSKTSA